MPALATPEPLMPQVSAEPPDPPCYLLFSGFKIEQSQELRPDPSLRRARRARALCEGKPRQPARSAAWHSQSQAARAGSGSAPLSGKALSDLIDRKPYLLRPLAAQLLPLPLAVMDPAERPGIDLSSHGRRLPAGSEHCSGGHHAQQGRAGRGRAHRQAGRRPAARDPAPPQKRLPPGCDAEITAGSNERIGA